MITFSTIRPAALQAAFDKAIKDNTITTWEKDSDDDYTHKATQWTKRGFLRPAVVSGTSLVFTIVFAKDESDKRAVYSFHAARIVETFVTHFPNMFTPSAQITPNAAGKDHQF